MKWEYWKQTRNRSSHWRQRISEFSKEIDQAIVNKELQMKLKAFTRSQEAGRRRLESAGVQSN